jgi:hypothetical protein
MQPTRTLLVTLAAGGLLTGAAITAAAITANGASAAGDQAAARGQLVANTPSPTPSGPNGHAPNGKEPGFHRGHRPGGPGGPGGLGGVRGLGTGPVLHGEFVTGGQNGSTTTVVVQTGTVTTKDASTITVQSTDGYSQTWTLDNNTAVRTGWANGTVKDIAQGDTVRVEGTRSGSTTTARFVGERPKGTAQGGQRGNRGSATPTPSATTTS